MAEELQGTGVHPYHFFKEVTDPKTGEVVKEEWLRVPVTKASTKGKEQYTDINLSRIDPATYIQWIWEGAKKTVNGSMTKITGPKTEQSKAKAMEVAKANVEKAYEGKVRIAGGRGKTSGGSRDVLILFKQKAIKQLKAQAKRIGKVKVSLVAASTWTKYALKYLETPQGQALYEDCRVEVEAMESKKLEGIDIGDMQEDPKLVAAASKRKAERTKEKSDTEAELENLVSVPQQRKGDRPQARH